MMYVSIQPGKMISIMFAKTRFVNLLTPRAVFFKCRDVEYWDSGRVPLRLVALTASLVLFTFSVAQGQLCSPIPFCLRKNERLITLHSTMKECFPVKIL